MHNNSTKRTTSDKPAKPYPEFPLYAHRTGRWAAKIRGTTHYFGPWDDPDGALAKYLDEYNRLKSGLKQRLDPAELTIKDLVNKFLEFKESKVECGKMQRRTWDDYKLICDMIVDTFGKRRPLADIDPEDFAKLGRKIEKRWGLHRQAKAVQYGRSVFLFGTRMGLIVKPVVFGPGFELPSRQSFRVEKAKKGEQLFAADEIKKLLGVANAPMRAMILLGINCGFGNADCAQLPMRAIDLDTRWLIFPRPKTGFGRRCPLWPETVAAVRAWLDQRPAPADPEGGDLVFLTAKGNSWMKQTSDNPISKEMRKLIKIAKIPGGRNFYTLRHTHRTIGDEVCDQRASGFIMGHVDSTMAAHYVERIDDERLRRVADYIRAWLYADGKLDSEPAKAERPRLRLVIDEGEASASA